MLELSEQEKQTFLAATNRRKAAGIRLRKVTFMADENQVISFNEFFSDWVEHLGKQHAVDYLIVAMQKADEALQRAIERRGNAPDGA